MSQPAPRRSPAALARREAILEAAREVFLEEGYQLASMDRVAERAGTTKRTVYDHFGAKEALFLAVVARACDALSAALPAPETLPDDPALGLPTFAAACVEASASAGGAAVIRLIVAEAERQPAATKALREAMAAAEAKLAAYLAAGVATGRLKPHDTARAAHALYGALAQSAALRRLIGGQTDLRAIATVVELFLKAYVA